MDVLSIPAVLSSILQNFDTEELVSTCRLVNQTWNYESCRILQSRLSITFGSLQDIEKYNQVFSASMDHISIKFQSFCFLRKLFPSSSSDITFGHEEKIQLALQRFKEIQGKYVTKLKYLCVPINPMEDNALEQSTVLMYTELFKMMYNNYFPNLRTLDLLIMILYPEPDTDFDADEFLKLQQVQKLTIPSLEHFSCTLTESLFQTGSYMNYPHGRNNASFLSPTLIRALTKVLMSSCPNLKSMAISDYSSEGYLHGAVAENLGLLPKMLKAFQIDSGQYAKFNNNDLSQLQTLEKFKGDNLTYNKVELKQFFQGLRNSLRDMHLSFGMLKLKDYPEFPLFAETMMSRLEILTLENFNGNLEWKQVPFLKKLKLRDCNMPLLISSLISHLQRNASSGCPICTGEKEMGEPISTIDNLTIDRRGWQKDSNATIEILFELPCCFLYNLKSLTLSQCYSIPLSKLFRMCGTLQELYMDRCWRDETITDETITGIRKPLLKSICSFGQMQQMKIENEEEARKHDQKIVEMLKNSKKHGSLIRESSYIGDLKDLETLQIEGDLSDKSILYGIAHCQRLRSLTIHSRHLTWRATKILKIVLRDLTHLEIKANRL